MPVRRILPGRPVRLGWPGRPGRLGRRGIAGIAAGLVAVGLAASILPTMSAAAHPSAVGPRSGAGQPAVAPDRGVPVTAPAGTSQPRPATGWGWPLPPPHQVVRRFAPPAAPWLAGNRGVDLAGRPGERVVAAGTGVVSFAGPVARIGVVSVTTGALRTTYEPLRVRVHAGEPVRAGQLLGTLTLTGSHCLPQACLHWGLLRATTYLDPLSLLGLAVVRLLPLEPTPTG